MEQGTNLRYLRKSVRQDIGKQILFADHGFSQIPNRKGIGIPVLKKPSML